MRKTIWALILATALAMAMAIGIPSASAATTTTSANNYYLSGNDTQNTNVSPMHAGDCTMYGVLTFSRPNAAGIARMRFDFNTATSHTTHFDQWHNLWKIVGFGNQPIATLDTIDGFRMSTENHYYGGGIDTTISMTTSQWLNIARVTWTGSC